MQAQDVDIAIARSFCIAIIRPFKWTLHNLQINVAVIREFNDQTVKAPQCHAGTHTPPISRPVSILVQIHTQYRRRAPRIILIVIFMNGL